MTINSKIALVFGASGLVGSHLIDFLLINKSFDLVKIFVRKKLDIKSNKIVQIISDFKNSDELSKDIDGDAVFCCLGTTIKKAGTQANFRKIDYELPLEIAKIALCNGVPSFLIVSAIGSDNNSSNFYLQTKGQLENDLMVLPFESLSIFRPSILVGYRNEFRFGEKIAVVFMKGLNPLMFGRLKKYRSIDAQKVAKAMSTVASNENYGIQIFESDEIENIASGK